MARPRKDAWLDNCYRCGNFIRTKFLDNGIDNGSVRLQCQITKEDVCPWKADGCRNFVNGQPQIIIKERGEKS